MRYFKNTAISILKGDITQIECDVMVNSCNQSLKKGCGICKAIYTKAGIGLENECEEIRSNIGRDLEAGEFVVSQGYNLPCQYVIHAFAPKCTFGFFEEQESIFRLLLKRIFEQVDKFKMQSIALPAIGTGIHKCSVEKTSQIFLKLF